MSSGNYSPFDHLDGKQLWDDSIASRGAIDMATWLSTASMILGMWWMKKWMTTTEFTDANQEIAALCVAAGMDRACIHCSSRSIAQNCTECKSKGS